MLQQAIFLLQKMQEIHYSNQTWVGNRTRDGYSFRREDAPWRTLFLAIYLVVHGANTWKSL